MLARMMPGRTRWHRARYSDDGASPAALNCPLCGQPALWVLDGGRQAFCGHDGCQLLTWDLTKTRAARRP